MRSRRDEQLFPDPAAAVVWAGICALDEASQHDVLRELRARLAFPSERASVGSRSLKDARAVAALRDAADILHCSPSVSEYRHLRREHSQNEWPPDASIRRWLGGSWNAALHRAHLDAVPEEHELTLEATHSYTREEAIAALKVCAAQIGRTPTFNNYLNWARSPTVRAQPGRRPSSQNVFERLFGGYVEALKATGLAGKDGTGLPVSTLQRSGKNYRWSDEDLMRAIAEVIEFIGEERFPTSGEYMRAREQMREQERAAGRLPRSVPAMNGIQRRFGGWRKTEQFYVAWKAAKEGAAAESDEEALT